MSQPETPGAVGGLGAPEELPVATPIVSTSSAAAKNVSPTGSDRVATTEATERASETESQAFPRPSGDDLLPPLPTADELAREAPAWLASAIIHMLLMIVLGLMAIAQPIAERFVLQLSPDAAGDDLATGEMEMALDMESMAAMEDAVMDPLPMEIGDVADTNPSLPPPVAELGAASAESLEPIQMGLRGREAGMKSGLLRAYGGTAGTQLCVEEALKWLARYQDRKTGLWNLDGPYADGARPNNRDAATALALLAFQGNGHTPAGDEQDPYTRLTARAWNALLKRQDDEGNFFQEGTAHGRLYTQAMCTIALCELYGMTRDEEYRKPAERAIAYCVKIQSREGGWRYNPGSDADLSVTGWFVMALQSARMAGLDVPEETLQRVRGYLDDVSYDGGAEYSYQKNNAPKLSMTAEGLLCRQYLGWARDRGPLQRGVRTLTGNLPNWSDRDCYYWYYATQVCHHMEGQPWRKWNNTMRVVLPDHQVREGRERGSWDPGGDRWGGQGGRLFVTCLHTFMLEVYYRHLPIYQMHLLTDSPAEEMPAF